MLNDLYLLVHKQSQNGVLFENAYTFERQDVGGSAVALAAAFRATIVPLVAALQPNDAKHLELVVTNLGNLGDNANLVLNETGSYGNVNSMPLLNAINFTLKPTLRSIRPGSKRISPVPGEVATDDYVTSATYVTSMDALRDAFGAFIGEEGDFYAFVIVQRVKTAVPDTMPQKYTYTLPTIGDTPVYAPLRAVLINTKVSSQVSRKK